MQSLARGEANIGLVAYEMAMLTRRMGKYLAAPARFAHRETTPG